jgi:adenylate cyclase
MKQFLRCLLLLLFSFGAAGIILAQKQDQPLIDSLLKELPHQKEDTNKVTLLKDLSYGYSRIRPDESLKYGQQALELATKLQWKKGLAWANNDIGNYYFYKTDLPIALEYYFKSIKLSEEIRDKRGISAGAGNIGNVFKIQGDCPKALAYLQKALKMSEEMGDENGIARITGSIGALYCDGLHDYPKALEYFFKALKISEKIGNKKNCVIDIGSIGNVYIGQKNYAMGIEFSKKALKMAEEMGNKYSIGCEMYIIANAYISSVTDTTHANVAVAVTEMPHGKFVSAGQARKPNVDIPMNNTARLHKSIEYSQRGLLIGKELNAPGITQYCYENLKNAYKLTGDYKKALDAADNYRAVKDSVFSKENNEKIVKLGMKNEYDRQHLTDSLKTDEREKITALKLQRQRSYTGMGLAGILLLVGFSFFIVKERGKSEKERKKSDDLLLNILPGEVANELKTTGTTTAKHYNNVTVLFTDFVDFTQAGERMSPQALIDELHTCFKAFDDITSKYNVEKIKTIGDAYLAVGGLPTADPKHAENIVRSAIEISAFMQDRVAKLGNSTFEIRIGIHSGSVVAGIVGVKKFAYDIWGDTVNTAARMEQNSEPGKINISETTYELVKNKIDCEYRGEIEAKGKGMLKMYFVG